MHVAIPIRCHGDRDEVEATPIGFHGDRDGAEASPSYGFHGMELASCVYGS